MPRLSSPSSSAILRVRLGSVSDIGRMKFTLLDATSGVEVATGSGEVRPAEDETADRNLVVTDDLTKDGTHVAKIKVVLRVPARQGRTKGTSYYTLEKGLFPTGRPAADAVGATLLDRGKPLQLRVDVFLLSRGGWCSFRSSSISFTGSRTDLGSKRSRSSGSDEPEDRSDETRPAKRPRVADVAPLLDDKEHEYAGDAVPPLGTQPVGPLPPRESATIGDLNPEDVLL